MLCIGQSCELDIECVLDTECTLLKIITYLCMSFSYQCVCVCVFITFYTLYSVHIHVTSVISYDGACFFHYRQVSVYCNTDLGSLMLDAGIITSLQNIKFFVYETSFVVLMLYIDKEGQLCNT